MSFVDAVLWISFSIDTDQEIIAEDDKKVQFLIDLFSTVYARPVCKKSAVDKYHLKVR